MSLVLAIPCKGAIVIAADGRSTDFETGEARPPVGKLFKLTSNSPFAITGEGLVDELDKYMDELVETVKATKKTDITEVAKEVEKVINRRNWAEDKDAHEKCHMEAIVVGYGDEPKIYSILDNREFEQLAYCVLGNWKGAIDYLVQNISKKPWENTQKIGDKVAIKMLGKASKANPAEIGKPFQIWHVTPTGVGELDETEVTKLDERYNGK